VQIAVVDYGMGNLRSVSKALEHVAPGARIAVSGDPALIRASDRVVVPGEGETPHSPAAARWRLLSRR
jgi:imidazole glycerol-phosphate synthase subunit HisH